MGIQVVILAAGQGKRMQSALPKVLHTLAGRSLLEHVLATATAIEHDNLPIIVYGHQGEILQRALSHYPVQWSEQTEQLGTAHAVKTTLPLINDSDNVLILYGDVPLVTQETLQRLIAATPENGIGILTADLTSPVGYGRIKRDAHNHIIGIVEEKDASKDEKKITEVNSGIYYVPAMLLKKWLPLLKNNNAQNEFYLTDIIALASKENISVQSVAASSEEILGVNDRVQLAVLERCYQRRLAEKLLREGVMIMDPARIDVRGVLIAGKDVVIDINTIFEGRVEIGAGCIIGPNVILRNTILAERVEIKANSVVDGAEIAADCVIGPFARIRPGSVLAQHAHIGNFVEVKNSEIGSHTKINHLSYVGDAEIGSYVNVGAGTITCNYDGVNKHKTIIGDHAFIGSGTELVAPVSIGAKATIGAGSTITNDAPAGQLTLARVQQTTIEHWERPRKKEKLD